MPWWNEEPDIGLRAAPEDFPDILLIWRCVAVGDHPDILEWEERTDGVFSPCVLLDMDTLARICTDATSTTANPAWVAAGGAPPDQWAVWAPAVATLVARSLKPEHQTWMDIGRAMDNLIRGRHWFGGPDAEVVAWLDDWFAVESEPGGWFAESGLPVTTSHA